MTFVVVEKLVLVTEDGEEDEEDDVLGDVEVGQTVAVGAEEVMTVDVTLELTDEVTVVEPYEFINSLELQQYQWSDVQL